MAYGNSATGVQNGGTTLSVSITPPDGSRVLAAVIQGDLVSASTWTLPSGFSQIGFADAVLQDNGKRVRCWIFEKISASSESGTYTFTASQSSSYAACVAYFTGRGGGAAIVQNTSNAGNDLASPAAVPLGGVTALANDDIFAAFAIGGDAYSGTWTGTPPSSYTERGEATASGAFGLYAATRDAVSAGATGTLTATLTNGTQGSDYCGIVVALPDTAVTPNLTDVDTDEVLGATQIGATLTGTHLGANTAARTVALVQGATVIPQTQTGGNATSGTFNVTGFGTGGLLKYGTATTLRAVVGADTANLSLAAVSGQGVPIAPPAGRAWVTFGTLDTTAAYRLEGDPGDIAPGHQLEYSTAGGTLTVNADGTVSGTSGSTTSLTGRIQDGTGWSADVTIAITGDAVVPPESAVSTICDDTAGGVVRASLRLIGAIASGETPTADELQDGLCLLQDLLQHWSTHNLAVYGGVVESFQTVAGQAAYTIGPAGNWNTVRPVRIPGEAVCRYQGVDFTVEQIPYDEYLAIGVKATQSPIIERFAYVNDYPLGQVFLYPTPQQAVTIQLNSDRVLTSIESTATPMSFPPGYKLALRYALAMLLAPEYGITPSQDIRDTAKSTFAAIKRANKVKRSAQFDPAIGGDSAGGDWRSGG